VKPAALLSSPKLLWPLGLALLVLTVWLVSPGRAHRWGGFSFSPRDGAGFQVVPGPWGELEVWDLRLEIPEEFVGKEELAPRPTRWNFGNITEADARQLLAVQGCTTADTEAILRSARTEPGFGALVAEPPEEVVLRIPPEVRSRLYLFLSRNPANRYYQEPVYLPGAQVERILRKKSFSSPREIRRLLERLVYPRNGFAYFSDPEIILRHLPNDGERMEFLRSIFAVDAVQAGLRILPGSDLEKPLTYWTRAMPGVTAKDLKPLLESFRNLQDPGSLSLLYVLPPMARLRLYTTPRPEEMAAAKPPDCHWTALNFFRNEPDPRLSDNAYASEFIKNHYYQIGRANQPGDLLLVLNPQGQVIHSATYIAADLYFTKNGLNVAQPWVLMREKDLTPLFSKLVPARLAYFRKKEL